ncbi:unnamed protein product [Bursaphelenchus xylophilus]|uniref:Large ribosomal subunit protein eL28 n=1 Tax=Bursaphelenchus xylophilus TaxID=6326 RepID=A0A1I7RWP0_BURXY|nr:unnamed protein product [Bursaphelenchus xylophilus]CAG9128533.1 unnamed protein product [Bursaphelenchus xylophilus]
MVAINNASAAIQWNIIRRHSANLHKRRGIRTPFSTDRFNLTGKYTTRSSGLGSDAAVSVRLTEDNKGIVVETKKKSQGAQHRPATSTVSVTHKAGGPKAVLKAVRNHVKGYEPALAHKAQKRASQLLRSVQTRKTKKSQKTAASA